MLHFVRALIIFTFLGLSFSVKADPPFAFWKPLTNSSAPWKQEAYVKSSNLDDDDRFGLQVAISGNLVIAGAYEEDGNQNFISHGTVASATNTLGTSGAAFIFQRTGTLWVQQAYLKASNANASDSFGGGVAINGTIAVVGASGEDSNQRTITNGTAASADNSSIGSGAAYVFVQNGTLWSQQAYLKASNADTDDGMGSAFPGPISLSGETIVIGVPNEDSGQAFISHGTVASTSNSSTDAGAAYVFVRTGTLWTQQAYLKPTNMGMQDAFGISTAIDGDTAVVGAYLEDSNQTFVSHGTVSSADNSANGAGAAYVFQRTGTLWVQQAYLKGSNTEASDAFGHSVSISGDTIVVGARSEASNQSFVTNGTLVVDNDLTPSAGAAYVFQRTGTLWVQQAYLKAPNPDSNDFFGYKVVIDGDRLVAGALNEDSNQSFITNGTTASLNNTFTDSGAAYVFKRTGTTWEPEAYIKPVNVIAGLQYAYIAGISGNTVVAGSNVEGSNQRFITNGTTASTNNSIPGAGAVYIYSK